MNQENKTEFKDMEEYLSYHGITEESLSEEQPVIDLSPESVERITDDILAKTPISILHEDCKHERKLVNASWDYLICDKCNKRFEPIEDKPFDMWIK